MLSVGFFEVVIIVMVALVVLGPERLPWLMRKLAFFYKQFVHIKNEVHYQMMSIEQEDLSKRKAVIAEKEKVSIDE